MASLKQSLNRPRWADNVTPLRRLEGERLMTTPMTPMAAAAHLYCLAEAERLLRLFREAHDGRDAADPAEVSAWVQAARLPKGTPTPEDHRRAEQAASPEVLTLARRCVTAPDAEPRRPQG